MVTGFEEFSYEMTPFEKEHILPFMIESWGKVEVGTEVSMKAMIKTANKHCATNNIIRTKGKGKGKVYTTDGPRMRKVIHHIRKYDLVPKLIATSKGYFKTDQDEEVKKFIQSCRERANSYLEIANAMEHHYDLGTPTPRKHEPVQPQKSA